MERRLRFRRLKIAAFNPEAVAKNREEARKLVEAGFEYVMRSKAASSSGSVSS
jgi:hypothetical protein